MRPFIVRFQTSDRYYIYDVNTNEIIDTSKIVFDLLGEWGELSEDQLVGMFSGRYGMDRILSAISRIKECQEVEKLFSSNRPEKLEFSMTQEDFNAHINKNLGQLTLSVTEECNLSCGYPYQRKHSRKSMSFSTAKKAVDLYMKHSPDMIIPDTRNPDADNHVSDLSSIGFYGGEPLLNIELISKVLDYVKKDYPERTIAFHSTSNGTVLTPKNIKPLVEHSVFLLISLDGPKGVYDKMRRFKNNRGSFDAIVKNLRMIKERYPVYYDQYISFCVTQSSQGHAETVYKFFIEDTDLFSNKSLRVNSVDPLDTTLYEEEDVDSSNSESFKYFARMYYDTVIEGKKPDKFLASMFTGIMNRIHKRCMHPPEKNLHPNGICIPGGRRIFCTVDGDLTLCERVNPGLNIGHVDTGIDSERALELAREYAEISSEDCVDCWAVRFCSLCFMHLYRDKFDIERKRLSCGSMKLSFVQFLSIYCAAREKNDKAFDYLDEITFT